MSQTNFDIAALRSLVAGMDLGSFAKAADRVARSSSAVSAQIRKLEAQAGTPLFRKAGRGLELTDAGASMLSYARRLIELNDEAAAAVRGVNLDGWVRIGLPEDFGEAVLPDVLGRFARAHPKVRIEARVARNAELLERLDTDQLDLALVWGDAGAVDLDARAGLAGEVIDRAPMRWIGAAAPVAFVRCRRTVAARGVRSTVRVLQRGDGRVGPGRCAVADRVREPEPRGPVGGRGGRARGDGAIALRPARVGAPARRGGGARAARAAEPALDVVAQYLGGDADGRAARADHAAGGARAGRSGGAAGGVRERRAASEASGASDDRDIVNVDQGSRFPAGVLTAAVRGREAYGCRWTARDAGVTTCSSSGSGRRGEPPSSNRTYLRRIVKFSLFVLLGSHREFILIKFNNSLNQ